MKNALVKFTLSILFLLAFSHSAFAIDPAYGWCELGNRPVVLSGLTSALKYQQSFPACTVTVYTHGTVTKAVLFSDNASTPTPLTNPFAANADGHWQFYTVNGRYDIVLSGAGFPAPYTISDWVLQDVTGSNLIFCDGPIGSTASVKLAACITALPSTGGIVIATSMSGAQTINTDFCAGIAGTKPVQIIFGAATFTVSTDVTCPQNVIADLANGTLYSVSTTKTLTFNGTLTATQSTHFTGAGSVSLNQVTSPKWFGAKGNGRTVTDAAMTNGSPTLTSATANFTSYDIGSTVYVCDATSSGVSLGPVTITAVTSTTVATLSSNAAATVGGKTAVIGYNDQDGFTRAIAATPTSGAILVPVSTGFYYIPQTKTATGLGAVIVTKDLTISGETLSGNLSNMVKIKTGPEQVGTVLPTVVTFILFAPSSSTNVVFRDLNIEGPEHTGADNVRCFYPGTTNSVNTITVTNVYSRKCGTFLKMDQAATNGGKKLYVNNSDIDTAVDDPTNGLQNTFLIGPFSHVFVAGGTYSNHTFGYTFYLQDNNSYRVTGATFVKATGSGDNGQYYIACHGVTGTGIGLFQQVSNSSFDMTDLNTTAIQPCGEWSTKRVTGVFDNNVFFSEGTNFPSAFTVYGPAAITNSYFRHVAFGQIDVAEGAVSISNSHFLDSSIAFGGTGASSLNISDSVMENVGSYATLSYLIAVNNPNATFNFHNLKLTGGGPETPNGGGATAQIRIDNAGRVDMSGLRMYNSGIDKSILIPTLQSITGELNIEDVWFQDTTPGLVYNIGGTPRATGIQPRHAFKTTAIASATQVELDPNYDTFHISGTAIVSAFSWGTAASFNSLPTLAFDAEISLIADGAFQMRDSTWIRSRWEGPREVGSISKLRYDNTANKWIEFGDAVLIEAIPTLTSGFGTSPSVVGGRAPSFQINVGTGGVATGGVITLPAASNGWNCTVDNTTALAANRANQRTVMTASTTTTVTVQNQTISTGAALAWTASDKLALICIAY